jgi:hypothetical protein
VPLARAQPPVPAALDPTVAAACPRRQLAVPAAPPCPSGVQLYRRLCVCAAESAPGVQDRAGIGSARSSIGLRLDWKAGWQVGGFQSGWGSYVGFFAGFFYHFGGELADSLGINYGIFAKHTLFPSLRVRPFLAYGLGATQVWVRELEGRGIGHVTRLSAGLDTKVSERLAIEFELAYQFNILASFAVPPTPPGSYDFHTLSLTAGIWYGR